MKLDKPKDTRSAHEDTANSMIDFEQKEQNQRREQMSADLSERLSYLDALHKKPRDEKEEKGHQDALSEMASEGKNTFISYEDLEQMASEGKEFFLPPGSAEDDVACFSCGDGKFYKGNLNDIRKQVSADLKNSPENKKLAMGLDRINQEILAKPNWTKKNDKETQEQENQESSSFRNS